MTFTQRKWVATPILAAAIIIAMLLTQLGAYGFAFLAACLGFIAYLVTFVAGEKQLHPVTFIIFTSALYFLAIPADLVTSTDLGGFDIDLSFYYLSAYAVFLGFFVIATPSIAAIRDMEKQVDLDPAYLASVSLVALLTSIVIYFGYNLPRFGFSLSYGLDRALLMQTYSTVGQFAKTGIIAFVLVQCFLKYRYGVRIPIIVWVITGIFVFYDILILGDRRATVGMFVAIFALRSMAIGFQIKWYHIVGGLFLAFLLQIWSSGRTIGLLPMVEMISNGTFFRSTNYRLSETEFGGATMVLNYTWPTLDTGFMISYKHLLYQLTPNFLLEAVGLQQPISLSEMFVRDFFTEVYLIGGAFAYNIVLEAQQNFGYLGLIIVPVFLARMPFWLARITPIPPTLSYATFIVFGSFLIRQELSTLKAWVYAAFLVIVIILLERAHGGIASRGKKLVAKETRVA